MTAIATSSSALEQPLVQAHGLTCAFAPARIFGHGRTVKAVTDVDISVSRGEVVGLVGESGSGKSTVGRLLLALLRPTAGQVLFEGTDLATLDKAAQRRLHRRMQLVFQDPYSSLDPRRRVGAQIADGLAIHDIVPAVRRSQRVSALLEQVGLAAGHAARFPHEFSGGQRQRIGIARALATQPDFLVADEPVSALDVSIQAQVLALLADLRTRLGLAMLFISHDLAAVRHLCDRVVVLYLGRVMEEGPTSAVFAAPQHPYTAALLSAAPSLDPAHRRKRILLRGEPPSAIDPPSGCVFRTRCAYALPACAESVPRLRPSGMPGQFKACIRDDLAIDAGARITGKA